MKRLRRMKPNNREVTMTVSRPRAIEPPRRHDDCLAFTCMKWSASGELSELDRQLVLQRLARVERDLPLHAGNAPQTPAA
ncbi:MAG: hypothetical protein RLZZ124_1315 [Cyanobacteriota bacterium]|jgi:hypothetical protein